MSLGRFETINLIGAKKTGEIVPRKDEAGELIWEATKPPPFEWPATIENFDRDVATERSNEFHGRFRKSDQPQ